MFNVDLNSIKRVAASAVAALILSATCVGMAVAPAGAVESASIATVLSA